MRCGLGSRRLPFFYFAQFFFTIYHTHTQ
jgi:hypothetical protein